MKFSKEIVQQLRIRSASAGLFVVHEFKNLKYKQKSTASVLVPLCNVNGIASVLFTVRTQKVGTHKGQVSFPGGHTDNKETARETALRETIEELGPGIGNIEIIGECAPLPSITGTLVTPVIGLIEQDLGDLSMLTPSVNEVDKVFVRSIEELISPGYLQHQTSERLGTVWNMPVFGANKGDEKIWGLTAFILECVLDKLIVPVLSRKQ